MLVNNKDLIAADLEYDILLFFIVDYAFQFGDVIT